MDNKVVLVTGGTGFIGANLVRRLVAKGFEVYCAVRPSSNFWRLEEIKDKVKLINLDLLDTKEARGMIGEIGAEYIFHLATYGGHPVQSNEQKIFETNVLGTVNLVNAAAKFGFKRMIVTGSSSEYGPKTEAMKETDNPEPNTTYGKSKLAATRFCQHKAQKEKLPIVIFRPFSVYGPWEERTRLIPTLIKRCLAGERLEMVDPKVARDFVYIDDIVEAFILALSNDKINGEVLNLCGGKQTAMKEVVGEVMSQTKAEVKVLWNQESAGRTYDVKTWVGDPKKIRELLGWQAKTSLPEGIKKTLEWFKEYAKFYH